MEDKCRSHTHQLKRQKKTAIHPTRDKSVHPSIANLSSAHLLSGSFSPAPSCNAPLLIITCLQHCARSPTRLLPGHCQPGARLPHTAPRPPTCVPRGEERSFRHCCKATTCPKADSEGRRVPAARRPDHLLASYGTALPKPRM